MPVGEEKEDLKSGGKRTDIVVTKIQLLKLAKELQEGEDGDFIIREVDAKYVAILKVDELQEST